MKISLESYRNMNRAYNTLYDEWQKIEGMGPILNKQLNMAMVVLDGVLDELKKAAYEGQQSEENNSDQTQAEDKEKKKPSKKGLFSIV